MSVSTEVQRTLVKSPPELWTELSTPEGLARHFGDLGEVRVTKVEPETAVEWEAGNAAGSVQLKQSGWGTKVTLSLTREPPTAEPVAEPKPEPADQEPAPPPGAVAVEPELAESEPTEPEPEPEACATHPEPVIFENVAEVHPEPLPEPAVQTPPEPLAKRGFFARLFKRNASRPVAHELEPAPEAELMSEPEPELQALALPDPIYPDPPTPPEPSRSELKAAEQMPEAAEPTAGPKLETADPEAETEPPKPDPAADLAEIEALMEQEANELLTGVLDRLGAAHHRPFSRG